MQILFTRFFWTYVLLFMALAGVSIYAYKIYFQTKEITLESAKVEIGTVIQTVTVSGKIEAKQMAKLGFPVSGTIQHIYKSAGDKVELGEVIASLTSDAQVAEYNAALAGVNYSEQVKKELRRGATEENRSVAESGIQVAEANLNNVIAEFDQALINAKQKLLSTNLFAYPTNKINGDLPPTVSGNYLCKDEGEYRLALYASAARSNRSYVLSGLDTGTYETNTDTPAPLGKCGLYIQFSSEESYRTGEWIIEIPNRRNPSYVSLQNEYSLLFTQRETAIKAAKENLELAKKSEAAVAAPATRESLAQVDATISQAEARLKQQEYKISDYTIRAPFAGVITDVDMKIGEPTSSNHTVTLVYEGDYELKARIPEIDITKVALGNKVSVRFDAAPNEEYEATITFISPISSEVGGVAYYDAYILLNENPTWLREGLNADIKIESNKKVDVTLLPKRFIFTNKDETSVLIKVNDVMMKKIIRSGFVGTDGRVEVLDLSLGTEVFLP